LSSGRREERLGLGLSPLEDLLEPAVIVGRRGRSRDLFADDLPETFRRVVDFCERQCVEASCAVASRGDPLTVEKSFQMPADCRLRELHDVAEFRNCELPALEDGEHAHANRIGKDCELIDDGRIHPYNRMKE
jgi:hypothetical protein